MRPDREGTLLTRTSLHGCRWPRAPFVERMSAGGPVLAITHCLWFDGQAEEAARHYVSIFGGRLGRTLRYTDVGQEVHGQPAGAVMTVEWEVLGQRYIGVNGGPQFTFNEAFSIQALSDTQEEIDRYWERLCEGGEPGHCGWLKDR